MICEAHEESRVLAPSQLRAFREGEDAFVAAMPRSACPYADGTAEAGSWLAGWDLIPETEALRDAEKGDETQGRQ